MAINAQRTVVGIFDERGLADKAVEDLQNAGFSSGQIYYHGPWESHDTDFWQGITRFFLRDKPASHDAFAKQFRDLGFSDDEIRHFEDEYDMGHAIVAVKAPGREEEALAIFRINGGHN